MTITEGEYKDLQDADEAIFELMKILEKKMDDQYHDINIRTNTQINQVSKLTIATNALMQIVKQQQALFQQSMLWIVASFAAMQYEGTATGLKLILGEPQTGAKPDEDSEPTT